MKKLILASLLLVCYSQIFAADATVGWRGNWTGLWPNARPPLEWHRLPLGVLNNLRFRADKPGDKADRRLIVNGLVQEWLVLGPFPVSDSIQDFDKPQPR